MGYQNHAGTYVKILSGKYAGQYGEAGVSSSDHDLVEVFPFGAKDKYGSQLRLLLDVFQDIEVVKDSTAIQILYNKNASSQNK